MAFKKTTKSYLLVAAFAASIILGGISFIKVQNKITDLNNQINTLNKQKINLEEKNKSMEKQIQEKNNTIDTITEERNNIKESNEKLQQENKTLEQKLVKAKEEVSAKVASAEYPTQSISRGSSIRKGTPITMTLTFYGDGAGENGGYAGLNAYSQKLTAGMVASNVYPRGTKFVAPNGQVLEVQDKGGSHFNSHNRLDVFVPRKSGESSSAYAKRIRSYGKRTVTMYKI